MKCSRSKGLLALYVEGDLNDSQCGPLDDHLRECGDCRNLAAELVESQALLKSLRGDAVPEAALLSVRRQVLPRIARIDNSPNWALRVERALMSRFRPRYAMTAIAAILVVSGVFAFGIVWRTGSESIPVAEVVQPAPEAVPPSVDVDRRLPDPEPSETVVEAPVQSRPLVELASAGSEVAVADAHTSRTPGVTRNGSPGDRFGEPRGNGVTDRCQTGDGRSKRHHLLAHR